jgi:hypothetical protein
VTDETGAIGRNFEGAEAAAGPGLTLEIVGGVVIVAAGVVALLLPARSVSEREPRPAPQRE